MKKPKKRNSCACRSVGECQHFTTPVETLRRELRKALGKRNYPRPEFKSPWKEAGMNPCSQPKRKK
jgi:hypothetical protein